MHFWRGQHFFYSERSGFSHRRGTVVSHTAREKERTEEKKTKDERQVGEKQLHRGGETLREIKKEEAGRTQI